MTADPEAAQRHQRLAEAMLGWTEQKLDAYEAQLQKDGIPAETREAGLTLVRHVRTYWALKEAAEKKLARQERKRARAVGGVYVPSGKAGLRKRTKALLRLPKAFFTQRRDPKVLRAAVNRLREKGYHDEADYALRTWA